MALLVLPLRRAASSLARGGTCAGPRAPPACPPCERVPPACPPCERVPPPPCRARLPPARRGTRVVCCAPAPGTRPPCARPAPAAPLTCRGVGDQDCVSPRPQACLPDMQPSVNPPSGWVCDQDPVALRLQVARSVRRAHYEQEVALRAAAPPPPPCRPARYVLRGERECARATDGCTYAVLPARCGPGRTPPPPRCVELAPDDGCRIRGDMHLDPCAHRPRVMIQIDRSASQSTCSASPPSPGPTPCLAPGSTPGPASCPAPGPAPCPAPYPAPGPTPGPASCPAPGPAPCPAPYPAPGPALGPAPRPPPPRCRRLTIIERLRAHVPGCQSERRIHTSSALSIAKKSSESMSGGLEGVLRSKEQLKEAGLGRFVNDVGAGPSSPEKPTGGRLELSVPPGTERVAVHVSLSRAAPPPPPPPAARTAGNAPSSSSACDHFDPKSERRNPCLSINQIRKKWTGQYNQKSPRTQCEGAGYADTSPPASLSGPAVTPRSEPGTASTIPSNEPKTKTTRCSSSSAFMTNTIVAIY